MDEATDGIHGKSEPSRALVRLDHGPGAAKEVGIRPRATFLAQVMACEARLPEFRQHRRAQPLEAAARYQSAHHRWR